MKKLILILVLTLIGNWASGQNAETCPCCTSYHQQFDFWVGDWKVYNKAGQLVGENTITKLENGCILNEHWRGATGSTGRSYNYFNLTDSTWNQLWIDNSGSHLELKGEAKPNQMILQSKLTKGQKVSEYYNRISWTKNEDNSVTQLWEILDKDFNVLSVAFEGIYRKK